MVGGFDANVVIPYKPKLFVCNPNRITLGILKEAYDINRELKVGNINELSFKVPYTIDINHELSKNKNADRLLPRRLIRCEYNGNTEYYAITEVKDEMTDSGDAKVVTCMSLGVQLSWRNIRNYSEISLTATEILNDLLSGTGWHVGTVDPSFDEMRRSPNIDDDTVLGSIFTVAEVFNALVVFDTVAKTISLAVLGNLVPYKGFKASYGRLLESASKVQDMTEFCTMLKVEGRDGISINAKTPAGVGYLENYYYYLYPYQEDEDGNVIAHSNFMSDSLSHALLAYKKKLEDSAGLFAGYLSTKSGLETTLTSQQNVLYGYQNQLKVIQDQLAVANSTGADNTAIIAAYNAKTAQITSQNTAIAGTQSSINAVNAQITALSNSLSIPNNFNETQIDEWSYYINERSYVNDLITDETELLQIGEIELQKQMEPKIVVEIDLVDFLKSIDQQKLWPLFGLGEQIEIFVEKLGINVRATITEIRQNFESGSISITIANTREIIEDERRLLKKLYSSFSSANTVKSEKYGWRNAITDVNAVNVVINNPWDATQRIIRGGTQETLEISNRGIIVSSLTNPDHIVIMQSGGIFLSLDNGMNWQTAITAEGIVADAITVGTLTVANSMQIRNSNSSFIVDSSGVTVRDMDLIVTRSDNKNRIIINATDGIRIQKNISSTWTNQFYADVDGGVIISGALVATSLTGQRIELNSQNNLLQAINSPGYSLNIVPNVLGAPGIQFVTPSSSSYIIQDTSGFAIVGSASGQINFNGPLSIDGSSVTIRGINFQTTISDFAFRIFALEQAVFG